MHSEQKSKIHVNWFILILFHSSSSLPVFTPLKSKKKTKFPREISDEALKSQANTAEVEHEVDRKRFATRVSALGSASKGWLALSKARRYFLRLSPRTPLGGKWTHPFLTTEERAAMDTINGIIRQVAESMEREVVTGL